MFIKTTLEGILSSLDGCINVLDVTNFGTNKSPKIKIIMNKSRQLKHSLYYITGCITALLIEKGLLAYSIYEATQNNLYPITGFISAKAITHTAGKIYDSLAS